MGISIENIKIKFCSTMNDSGRIMKELADFTKNKSASD